MHMLELHDKTAIWAGEREITYRRLLDDVARLAGLLELPQGSRVALYAVNSPEWAEAFYAVWHKRLIVVPVDHTLPVPEVAYILGDCRPSAMFCCEETIGRAEEAIRTGHPSCRLIRLDALPSLPEPPEPLQAVAGEPSATAAIIYTSGTTGQPKGVMLSFNNLMVNLSAVIEAGYFGPEERVLVMLPLHHILPLAGTLLAPLRNGAAIVFSPSLSPADIMAALQRHHVTTLIAVPRFYALITGNIRAKIAESRLASALYRLAARVRSPSFSRALFKKVHEKFGGQLRFMICGGAPLDLDVAQSLTVLGFRIYEGYGMTETAPIITFPRPDAPPRLGACGRPLDINEVRLEDGEIITRGPNVMQGYYNRPEETAEALQGGWLHTGDLGRFDEDGYLYITGRKKDLLVLPNGKKINPLEIEEKICSAHPEVLEAGVFLLHNALRVVLRFDPGFAGRITEAELDDYARNSVIGPYNRAAAPYKRLVKAHLVREELPKTRLGKVRRFMLHELAAQTPDETRTAVPEPDTDVYRRIKEFLARTVPVPVQADSLLADDLGLDSLGRISLQVYLQESFGVDLDDADMQQVNTPRLLAQRVDKEKSRDAEARFSWREILARPPNSSMPASGLIHVLLIGLAKVLGRFCFRLRIQGLEKLPAEGPFILVANHQSYVDALFLAAAVKTRILRNTFFYAKEKHVRRPVLRYMANRCNVIVVDVNSRLMESIQKMGAALQRRKNIIIFPEGTRTRDGRLGDFRPTFAILSVELGIPVVPLVIDGAYQAMPAGRHVPRLFSNIRVHFLDPVPPLDGGDYDKMTEQVRACIQQQLPPAG